VQADIVQSADHDASLSIDSPLVESSKVESQADALWCWLLVSAVFIGVSLLMVPMPGVNEPHYLTKARSYADPAWCANDFFLQSGDAHAVFFAVVGPITEELSFQTTIVLGRILSLSLLAWGWGMLGRRLGLRSTAIVMATCGFCLIGMTGNFSGEWVVGGFESKVPAYGCALSAVALWLRAWQMPQKRRYVVAGIMAGLSVSWHPVVGLWFCIGIALTELLLCRMSRMSTFRPPTLPEILLHGACFSGAAFVCALPGLIPALQVVAQVDLPVADQNRANFIQVFWRLAHHLDPSTFPMRSWVHTGVLGVVCVVSLACVRFQRHRTEIVAVGAASSTGWTPLVVLLVASALTSVAGILIGWHSEPAGQLIGWEWRAALLKFYPFRFFDALLPMVTALATALLLQKTVPRRANALVAAVLVIASFASALAIRPSAPSGYNAVDYATWKQACEWLKQNTPEDAVIYGPREGFGLKLFAERAEYVCFKDCPQDAPGILGWNQRLLTMFHWSQSAYQDGVFDRDDLRTLRQQTSVSYVVTRRLGPFEDEPVWSNSVWRIYAVPEMRTAR